MQESEINIDRHLGKQNWFKGPVSMLCHCDSMNGNSVCNEIPMFR